MNNQALFSSKGESKKLKCRLLQFLFGALRVKDIIVIVLGVPIFRHRIFVVLSAPDSVKLSANKGDMSYFYKQEEVRDCLLIKLQT